MRQNLKAIILLMLSAVILFTGCSGNNGAANPNTPPDENKAKAEGKYVTYGQPDDWANWKEMFQVFNAKYGITRQDTDMSSAEEITKFKAERNNPQADSAEIGMVWGPVAVKEGVTMAYKNANWDKIPDWAKDPDGNWFGLYVGVPVFLVNKEIVKDIPQSWADLLKPEYKNMVVMSDPRSSGSGVNAVLAVAYALGGDIKNLDPAMKYFAQLKKQGNIKNVKGSIANIQKGEAPIVILYDFLAQGYKEKLKNEVDLEIVFPKEGSIYAPGALILNKWAPHPNLAKLFADFVTSDEGQIIFAKGYARPIRAIAGNLTLPKEVKDRMLPESFYGNVGKPQAWSEVPPELIADRWTKEVLGQ
ncbi:MAG: extracellular solute-binding protein [Tepidanaerobacteraceae bacterium]|jgi:putative spermidine/putrescine transport system substrate-binding protein|nr:extracellular solute-binding protein [Tepidanaerobacteraceae bacterium]